MAQQIDIVDKLTQILVKLDVVEERQKYVENEVAKLKNGENILTDREQEERGDIENRTADLRYLENIPELVQRQNDDGEDINPSISSGDQILLESFKAIPEFSGVRGTYRPWRNQVTRRMKMIDEFRNHHKYEAALAIIRAKITGSASNVLTNFRTPYNIVAIIRRLDLTYADQRPLYVVEAEMTSIKQLNKTLQEFHDEES